MIIMRFYILILLFFSSYFSPIFAQGGPPTGGGNPCQTPFTPCWCAQNPIACANNPNIPINNELWILLAAGLIFGIYLAKKKNSNKTKVK